MRTKLKSGHFGQTLNVIQMGSGRTRVGSDAGFKDIEGIDERYVLCTHRIDYPACNSIEPLGHLPRRLPGVYHHVVADRCRRPQARAH